MAKQNWATNITFHDSQTLHPQSVDELAQIVASSPKVRVRGSGHCFNTIADSYDAVVVLDAMPKSVEIDSEKKIASVSAGANYAEVAEALDAQGWALHNLASLPHISIAGAIATGTHGSGIRNGALHTSVRAIELINADGSLSRLERDKDPDFYATVVGLGLTGVITRCELDIEPSYEIYQTVFGDLARSTFQQRLVDVLSGGYNTNFFTTFDNAGVGDVWFKSRTEPPSEYFGARARDKKVHPILSEDPEACTEQGGVPGPWHARLSHFRIDANPSAGNELQSEFFVSSSDASEAFAAVEEVAVQFGKKLMVSEIRAIAADNHWMSPAYQRESVAFHCTWKNDYEIPYLISLIEDALKPYNFRPHLGKVFNVEGDHLRKVLPKFDQFREHVKRVDPSGKFQNEFTKRLLEL